MPQYYSNHACDSFVSLAQLCSTPAIISDLDMTGQEQLDQMGIDSGSPLGSTFSGCTLDTKSEQHPMCSPRLWAPGSAMRMQGMRVPASEYSGSSPSDSPSPPGSVHQEQHQKRRAQNRAAQRAYRDRKLRYLLDLEQGIRDIEQKMMRLQNENTELIRELCEIRADNNDLRVARHPAKRSVSLPSRKEPKAANYQSPVDATQQAFFQSLQQAANDGDEALTGLIDAKTAELESLYEPFAAMWNLIRMDPSVVQGNVSAGAVLDRLRGMVEISGSRNPCSTSNVADWSFTTSDQG